MSVKTLLKLNKLFRRPAHPFNMQAEGSLSYAEWEHARGESSLTVFAPEYSPEDILLKDAPEGGRCGKNVLDLCCGAGGKSVYYAELGANVTGAELLEKYRAQAEKLAEEKGVLGEDLKTGSFRFVCTDASDTGLPAESFDTVIMSDAMEHVARPEDVIAECGRLLKPGGRLFISFPPYGHPYGAHVSDLIGIPWVQLLFSDGDIAEAYSILSETVPDGRERVDFRFSKDSGTWKNTYINKMSLKRFSSIIKGITSGEESDSSTFRTLLMKEIPLRSFLTPLAKFPHTKEYFVRLVVCVLEKTADHALPGPSGH